MNDFNRFLRDAGKARAEIRRAAKGLPMAQRDAVECAAAELLRAAYQAGRAEPAGTFDAFDVFAEIDRLRDEADRWRKGDSGGRSL